jgi:hypothetical protein
MTEKNKVGRPKTKMSDLPKGWEVKALQLYESGASDVEVRVQALDCMSDDLWYRLMKEEPEFYGTIKKGKLLCQTWWEAKGRCSLENKEFSYTGWYMNMKNRFAWADKQEVKQDNSGEINIKWSEED